jgi:hypothetical protein
VGGWVGVWEKSESKNYIPFGDVVKNNLFWDFRLYNCTHFLKVLIFQNGVIGGHLI